MPESHPFDHFVPQGATTLIIGTFPPVKKDRNFKFYYPNNRGNRFWTIMEHVFNYKFRYWKDDAAVEERKHLFEKRHIAITDMIETCIRAKNNSSDKNLSKIKFRNVYKLLKEYPTIQKIILTSRTNGDSQQIHKNHLSKSRNSSALELLNEHLRNNKITIQNLHKENTGLIKGKFKLNNRIIKIFVPYTPVARWYNCYKEKVNDMYKNSLNT
jgi:hypoxanthine-DNA glycosylase